MGHVDNSQIAPLYNNTTPGVVADANVIDPAVAAMIVAINENFDLFELFKASIPLPIPDQSIVERHLRNLAVTNPKLAPLAVTADKIADGTISTQKLADLVITAQKIANGTITEQKMANSSVSRRMIQAGAVGANEIDPSILKPISDATVQVKFNQITTLIDPSMTSQEIQTLLNNSGTFKFTKGTYVLDFLIGPAQPVCLDVQSNTKIEMEKGTVITIPPTSEGRYYIFQIDKKENVTIVGGEIIGDKLVHTGTTGEQGYGIGIRGSKNVIIDNVNIKQCWGDGIVLGRSYDNTVNYCDTVRIMNTTCDNNRRQGISVTSCRNLWITDCIFKNTNGTAPQAGIDLEPDQAYEALENINIINLKTENNAGAGILIAPFKLGSGMSKSQFNMTITIENHRSVGDFRGMYIVGDNVATQRVDGQITIKNSYVDKSVEAGIRFENWLSSIYPPSLVTGCVVKNPNGLNTNLGNTGRSGFVIYARNTYRDGEYGNVDFINCRTTDDRVVGVDYTTIKGFWFEGELATQSVKASVIDCFSDVYLAPGFVRWNKGPGAVTFSNQPIFVAAPGTNIRDASGVILVPSSSGDFTLPISDDCIGREFIFKGSSGITVNLLPQSSDTIIGYDYFPNKRLALSSEFDYVKVKSIGSGKWIVVEKQGNPYPTSSAKPPRVYYQTAPPTGIASTVGDTVYNIAPTAGGYFGWICITSGSPGTWKGFGLIQT